MVTVEITQTMDSNTDLSCIRTTDACIALGGSSGLDVIMALVASQATHISMAVVATWPLGIDMVSDGCPDMALGGNRS